MKQKSSLPKVPQFVSDMLTANSPVLRLTPRPGGRGEFP